MTNCNCSATTCANNQQGYCCRPNIKVAGSGAKTSSATACANYLDQSNSFTNTTGYQLPNLALDIRCEAVRCSYNHARSCCADDVCINCCSSGTECATFRPTNA